MWVENIQNFWYSWNIRLFILLSLSTQILLVLFASSRQRCRNIILRIFLWSTYLLADWIAIYAIGLISNSQCDPSKGNKNILAFWVSFLLLHLGGPDSITSYSLEDNQLWLRYLFELIAKVFGAAYILFQTYPDNNLLFPTILVLLVGTIKYAERLTAMYLANLKRFGSTTLPKPNPGHDYEEAVAKYTETRSIKVVEQTRITIVENLGHSYKGRNLDDSEKQPDDMELLLTAYSLFQDFKGLLVGYILNPSDQKSSRSFFLNIRSAEVSFRLVEYELSLMYQLLHTKVSVVLSRIGLFVRFLSLCSMVVASIRFHYLVGKDELKKFELILSYVLVSGAIFVDIISGIKLCFSDWLLIYIYLNKYIPAGAARACQWFRCLVPKAKCPNWSASLSKKMNSIRGCMLQGRKWSRSVSQYNMIRFSLELYKLEKFPFSGCFISMLDKDHIFWSFTSEEKNINELKCLIFEELKKKSSDPKDEMEAFSQGGDSALSAHFKLQWSINEFHYAESLLLWHLATELCYQDDDGDHEQHMGDSSKGICKIISDYMFYLLAKKPELLAPVLENIWQIVFQDTLEEAKSFFSKNLVTDHVQACKKLINVKPKYRSVEVKGNSSKSVLFDACILASQLQSLEENQYWKLMSRVWVELLCYSAINCQAIVHAQQLRKGGELLTFTWLLMNHLGLGSQLHEQEIKK